MKSDFERNIYVTKNREKSGAGGTPPSNALKSFCTLKTGLLGDTSRVSLNVVSAPQTATGHSLGHSRLALRQIMIRIGTATLRSLRESSSLSGDVNSHQFVPGGEQTPENTPRLALTNCLSVQSHDRQYAR